MRLLAVYCSLICWLFGVHTTVMTRGIRLRHRAGVVGLGPFRLGLFHGRSGFRAAWVSRAILRPSLSHSPLLNLNQALQFFRRPGVGGSQPSWMDKAQGPALSHGMPQRQPCAGAEDRPWPARAVAPARSNAIASLHATSASAAKEPSRAPTSPREFLLP